MFAGISVRVMDVVGEKKKEKNGRLFLTLREGERVLLLLFLYYSTSCLIEVWFTEFFLQR